MKIMQYLTDYFFKIYALREFYYLCLTICECLTEVEEKPDQQIVERLSYIKQNTHQRLLIPLSTAELIILTNMGSNINKPIEFMNNSGESKELLFWVIHKYAKESYNETAKYVVRIAKKYSLDIPFRGGGGAIEIPNMPTLPTYPIG